MQILHQPAHPALRRFVRSFGQRRASLVGTTISTPLPARPDQFIEFYVCDRYRIGVDGGPTVLAPETAVVGPQTRPGTRLHMSGILDVFTIRFQPTGFHRLFGTPMPEIADQGIAIGDVIRCGSGTLVDAIHRAADFHDRVAAAQRWLFAQAEQAGEPVALDHAARLLIATRGSVRIDAIAARSGLSERQFHRRFTAEVGVSPKFYARSLRLAATLAARARHPERSWTTIAHAAGYADQAHFIRECRLLAGDAPNAFVAQAAGMTEMFNSHPG